MRKLILIVTLFITINCFSSSVKNNSHFFVLPLSGSYFIPGDFSSVNDAVLALNSYGVNGPVIINVMANYVELAPAGTSLTSPGGIQLGSIVGSSSINTITFQKSGIGSNPKIVAGTNHFAGGIMDAIIRFVGTDFVIFDGFDLVENELNTNSSISTNNMTEFGFAFFKASNTDGAKNNIIRNCSIKLNTTTTNYQNTFGIFSSTITSSSNGLSLLNTTNSLGSNSNNSIIQNLISRANIGIVVIGSNTSSAMDNDWIIDQNTIHDFGIGLGQAVSAYQKVGTTIQGILINQCYNTTVNNNQINSTTEMLTNSIQMAGILFGWSGTVVQPSMDYQNNCEGNTINLRNNLNENTFGIWSRLGVVSSKIYVNNNSIFIENSATSYTQSKTTKGVFQDRQAGEFIANNNQINISYLGSQNSDNIYFIQADINTALKKECSGNNLITPVGHTLKTNGIVYGISHNGNSTNELSIVNNLITINKGSHTSASNFSGIYSTSSSDATSYLITNNSITLKDDNVIGGNATLSGIYANDGISGQTNKLIENNTILVQTKNNAGITHGIFSGKANVVQILNNQIALDNQSPTLNGIFLTTGSTNNQVHENNILISPSDMPANTTSIRGIFNSIGVLTTSNNQINLSPEFLSSSSNTITIVGIDNSIQNSKINNNTSIFIQPTFHYTTITGGAIAGIRNSVSGVEINNNSIIQVKGTNSQGNLVVYGVLNTGANAIIQANQQILSEATAFGSVTVIGINSTSPGLNVLVTQNNTIQTKAISTNSTSTSRGISITDGVVSYNTSISVYASGTKVSQFFGINGSGLIEHNNINATIIAQSDILTTTAGIFCGSNSIVRWNSVTTDFSSASGNTLANGIFSNGSNSMIEYNNINHYVVSSINNPSANFIGEVFGIRSFGADNRIEHNKIERVYGSMGRGITYFECAGIYIDNVNNPIVLGNTISNVSCNGTARDRIYLSGIYITGNSYNATIKNNKIFNISFNCDVTGTVFVPPFFYVDIPANTNGIWVRLANNTVSSDYVIVNNQISKLFHNNASKIGGIFGLALSTKELNYKVYHNTILIGDNDNMVTSNTTSHFGAAAVGFVNRVGNGSLDLRNNILYVNVMPRFSGFVSALAAIKSHETADGTINPGQTTIRPVNYHPQSNNNLFFAPSVHGRRSYFYCEGDGFGTEFNRFNIDHNTVQANDPNMNVSPQFAGCTSRYKTLMAGSDSNSFYQNVKLVEGSGDFEGVWTPVGETFAELGAQFIDAAYDLDFNSVSRGSEMDMGAVQFNGQIAESPQIIYSPITLSGCGLAPTTLELQNVQISDNFGIYTTGTLVPRVYYKINSGAWTSAAGTLISGDGTNGFWNFTLNGLTAGTLSYFVIAQDRLSKIKAEPGDGLLACNVNSITNYPITPNTLTLGGATAVYSSGSWSSSPDLGKAVVIDDDLIITSDIDACSLLVKAGRTVIVQPTIYVTVLNEVEVESDANFIFEDKSSLVQINNSANIGNISYQRLASIKRLDYVYWSSPVNGSNGSSGFNINNLSFNPLETPGPKYKWDALLNNNNGSGGNISQGTWVNASGNLMESGRGYIVRAPNSFDSLINQPYHARFIGTPFNGDLSYPIFRGDYNGDDYIGLNGQTITKWDDNFNLIGNPYPSSISAARFIFRNAPINGGSLVGGVRIWTHGSSPSTTFQNPFYGSFVYNYTSNDYLIYTLLGSSCCPALNDDFMIGAGQGFFVQMEDGPTASNLVYFNNTMRSKNFQNDNFYRNNNNSFDIPNNNFEKHRIWLDVLNQNLDSNRTLIGYATGASNGLDDLFDAVTKNNAALQIYSFIGTLKTTVQAKAIPIHDNEEIPIGLNIPSQGQYTIAIAGVDGMFEDNSVYLKDELLNIIHNLKDSPYHFQTNNGTIDDRFKILFNNQNLSLQNVGIDEIKIVNDNGNLIIKSPSVDINQITIFDVVGRKIFKNEINANETIISKLSAAKQTLLIQFKMSNNQVLVKKIIY